jgi:hypothetical protein
VSSFWKALLPKPQELIPMASSWPSILLLVLATLIASLHPLTAEQVRVAFPRPVVATSQDATGRAAMEQAELWQSLLALELARSDLFTVVEREDLPRLFQEWELARSLGSPQLTSAPRWLGADALLLITGSLTQAVLHLDLRWVTVTNAAVEQTWQITLNPSAPIPDLTQLIASLQQQALTWAQNRDTPTLVSISDFEFQSPFDRHRWLETGLPRRLRHGLRSYPGLFVLEREEMDALFTEKRLQRAGITSPNPPPPRPPSRITSAWHVSGRFRETQPAGQPLLLILETSLENRHTSEIQSWTNQVPAHDLPQAILNLQHQLAQACLSGRPVRDPVDPPPHAARDEALRLADQAVRLIGLPDLTSLASMEPFAWQLPTHAFSEARYPFDTSPQRRTSLLRAVRYLKTAEMLEPDHPGIKVLLSTLLSDRSVDDQELALDLAAEIGALYPAYRGPAWRFLAVHAPPDQRRHIRDRILEELPGSWEAKLANTERLAELVESHQHQADPADAIDLAQKWIDQALRWGSCQEADVLHLFQLSQVIAPPPAPDPIPPKLREIAVRDHGTRQLESLIGLHPNHAFYLTLYWLQNCKRYRLPEETLDAWTLRASQAALQTDHDPWVIGVRIDPWRIEWANRQMHHGRHREAAEKLSRVQNFHHVNTATFLLGQCAFALGHFAIALECFESFDASHREAARFRNDAIAWAARCREQLDLPANPSPLPTYTSHAETWDWEVAPFNLPPGAVTSLVADDRGLWVGLAHRNFWFRDNVLQLEATDTTLSEALRQGGLAHIDLASGQTRSFPVGPGLSHPWVMGLAIAAGRLWVGTYGKGIDSFEINSGTWSHHGESEGLPSNYIQCLDADPDNLWVGTGRFFRGGVARLNLRTGLWQGFLPEDYPGQPPPVAPVRCLLRVGNSVWCALERAIYRYEIDANRWTRWDHTQHFTSIAACANRVWFGADQFDPPGPTRGVLHVGTSGNDWQSLRQIDGLPDIAVTSMATVDDQLLLGSYGFMTFTPESKTFTTVDLRTELASWNYVVRRSLVAHRRLWVARQGENRLHSVNWPHFTSPAQP